LVELQPNTQAKVPEDEGSLGCIVLEGRPLGTRLPSGVTEKLFAPPERATILVPSPTAVLRRDLARSPLGKRGTSK